MRAIWRQYRTIGRIGAVTVAVAIVTSLLMEAIPISAVRAQWGFPFMGASGGSTESGPRGKAVSSSFAPNPTDVVPAPAVPPTVPPTVRNSSKNVRTSTSEPIAPAARPKLRLLAQVTPPVSTTKEADTVAENTQNTPEPSGNEDAGNSGQNDRGEVEEGGGADTDTADGEESEPSETAAVEPTEGTPATESEEAISEEDAAAGGDGTGPTVHGPPQHIPDSGDTPVPETDVEDVVPPEPDPGPAPETTETESPMSPEPPADGTSDTSGTPSETDSTTPEEPATSEEPATPEEPAVVEQTPETYTLEQLLPLLREEMENGIRSRGIDGIYRRYRAYIGERFVATAPTTSNFEMRGNCRLPWYEQMLKAPIAAPIEAERFSRELHTGLQYDSDGLVRSILFAREAMGLKGNVPEPFVAPTDPEEALKVVETKTVAARAGLSKAISTLTAKEADDLDKNLLKAFCETSMTGHTLDPRFAKLGRHMCNLMEKMDRAALYDSALALACLTNTQLLDALAAIPESESRSVTGVSGAIVRDIQTDAGRIIVGGRGDNVYQLDQMNDVCAVIDLGGSDRYMDGSVHFNRPILVVMDLEGNDYYEGRARGVQGSAVFGVSLLVDRSGNDIYRASDVAQGSALCGVGILVDMDGDDYYGGVRRVQGHALGGLGMLIDKNGRDQYHAALWAQGFGAPLGFGLIEDAHGDDTYYCGGWAFDGYDETPGYDGWGQGIGAGLRQIACGGMGVLLDGDGDDVYEYDYMGHGGGYWAGLGIARDFAGNDTRYGGTRKMYDGSPRGERMYQRFGCGFGCHYAIGFCFDDSGNDVYGGTIMGMGMGWDLGVGYLCDVGCGDDFYNGTGSQIEGYGMQAGTGVLFDYGGDDSYVARGGCQGTAPSGVNPDYHRLPECGGNFAFLVDYGGVDKYSCNAPNNAETQRGGKGGFLIDRPLPEEYEQMKAEYEAAQARRSDRAEKDRNGGSDGKNGKGNSMNSRTRSKSGSSRRNSSWYGW